MDGELTYSQMREMGWTHDQILDQVLGPDPDGPRDQTRLADSLTEGVSSSTTGKGGVEEDPSRSSVLRWLSWDELSNIPKPEPLIKGILDKSSLAWLVGDPGTYKTFIALDMALSVASGSSYLGRPTVRSPVAYITGEGVTGLSGRIRAWEASRNVQAAHSVRWLPQSMQVFTQGNGDLTWLLDNLDGVGLIVLDTQSRMTVGLDENDSADMGRFVEAVARIRDASGACVLIPHHSTKAGGMIRGHSIVHGAADTVMAARRLKHEQTVRLKCAKQKESQEFDPIWLRAVGEDSLTMVECAEPQPTGKAGHEWRELTHDD